MFACLCVCVCVSVCVCVFMCVCVCLCVFVGDLRVFGSPVAVGNPGAVDSLGIQYGVTNKGRCTG